MSEKIKKVLFHVSDWFSSTSFFIVTIIWFLVHSLWIVFSSNLLPYDEYYHLGIIKFYSGQWSPFISSQPAEMSLYGDVTRLPAYLYHYLMSFPYRILDAFTDNQQLIIIGLRLINVAFVIAGIYLFRKLLLGSGISKRITNIAILIFVSTPIVVILSAQSNYDNLMFLLTPVFFGLLVKLIKKPTYQNILLVVAAGMITTLVKFNFVVLFGAGIFYALAALYVKHKKNFWSYVKSINKSGLKAVSIPVVLLFILSSGLFMERTGYNFVKYRQVKVDCAKVQPIEVCEQYSPWWRNLRALNNKPENPLYRSPYSFTKHWGSRIMRGFVAIYANIVPDNLNQQDPYGHYVFKRLLPLPITLAYIMLIISIITLLVNYRWLWAKYPKLRSIVFSGFILALSLYVFNYLFYLKYGRAYAIQARYLLPVMVPVIAIIGAGIVRMTSIKWGWVGKGIVAVLITVYVINGGAFGWIIRAESDWYWQNQTVISINQKTQSILQKVIPN